MENGISIYPGLDNTLEENLQLIEMASDYGIHRIFTSLHIPETDTTALKREFGLLLQAAHRHDMEIISDVSPAMLPLLGLKEFNPSALRMLGITTLRLDDGFSWQEIAGLTRRYPELRIQLNASTTTSSVLQHLRDANADFSRIEALHNFYPRRGTGISEEALVHANIRLHRFGVRVSAFVPSRDGRRRSPLSDGLPTLEDHRDVSTSFAARHLVALGCDAVFLADALPTEDEIAALAALKNDRVTLKARLLTSNAAERQLLTHPFTARLDEARDAIRAQESRPLLKQADSAIHPNHTDERPVGAVTIDNEKYGRYMGELQIIRRAQPADPRTNVAAQLLPEDLQLMPYITPGRKFSFQFLEQTDII